MSQSGVFPFYTGHIGFANNLITVGDKPRVDGITITDPEETSPESDRLPQGAKGVGAMVSNRPTQNPRTEMIDDGPNSYLVSFSPHKGL